MTQEVEPTKASSISDVSNLNIEINGKILEQAGSKKILGVTIDENLDFKEHIEKKKQAGFATLRAIDGFITDRKGCSQEAYMKLYKAITLPVLDYAAPVIVSAQNEFDKEFGKVHRHAMIKASGCMKSTSTEMLQALTNTVPIDMHMKLRQAQEVIRIAAKHEDDPLKIDFNNYMKKPDHHKKLKSTFQLLVSKFNELKNNIDMEHVEKEFQYTKELINLSRSIGRLKTEEFSNTKERQEINIKETLQKLTQHGILLFTDGSTLGNPGPTGGGAAIFLNGYQSEPVLLGKPVSSESNNYHGELVGLEIALDYVSNIRIDRDTEVHIFTDCQGAILTSFGSDIPSTKVSLVLKIRELIAQIRGQVKTLHVHWVPRHIGILGNEIADKQAKTAAEEARGMDRVESRVLDSKEATHLLKSKIIDKWNWGHKVNGNARVQELFDEVGKRRCTGQDDRKHFSIMNQIISGHSKLNAHMSRINQEVSELCECGEEREHTDHYLFHCNRYTQQRRLLELEIEQILKTANVNVSIIDLKLLGGFTAEISEIIQEGANMALLKYIKESERF